MSKRNYGFTRVKNTSGNTMAFGWLGKVGVELAANETYDHEGVLPDELTPLEKDAYDHAVDQGWVEVTVVPPVEAEAKDTKTLIKTVGGASSAKIWDSDCPARYRVVDGHAILLAGHSTGYASITDGTNVIATLPLTGTTDKQRVAATGWDDAYYEITTGGSLAITANAQPNDFLAVLTAVRID